MVDSDAVAWARGRFPGLRTVGPAEATILSTAVAARLSADYAVAAEQYLLAAKAADDDADQRHHQLRAAAAMLLDGQFDAAGTLVDQVTASARSASDTESLADALGMRSRISMLAGREPEGFEALAEAVHLTDQLDHDPAWAAIIDGTGLALTLCGLVEESEGFHQRAAELAPAPDLRCWSLAQLTTCCTVLAATASDESIRAGQASRGIEIASEVIDLDGGGDGCALALARANRSVLHALAGRFGEAATDAEAVLESTGPMTTAIEAVARTGSVLARWGGERDGSVVDDCQRIVDLAPSRRVDHCIDLVVGVHVDALEAAGRHGDLRGVLDQHLSRFRRLRDLHHDLERAHIRLGLAHHRAEALSEIDPLTGLHNRRYLDRFVGDLVAATPNDGATAPGCVAVIDLDGFKPVNDQHGYAAGDSMLRELAIELRQQCRRADGVARLGGDEFVVVLPGTSPDTALAVLDRIRDAIAARRWSGLPTSLRITTSIGFTMVGPGTETDVLIDEASRAMQQAKRSGRDRVVAWADVEPRAPDRRRR